jgi:hypothetical protein
MDNERYVNAAHAMQSGVRLKMTREGIPDDKDLSPSHGETSPKHLRVGVNSALSTLDAHTRLLIAKGVFTEEEYIEAVTEAMEREVDSYREALGLPPNVHLG